MRVSPCVTLGLTSVRCVASGSYSSFRRVSESCPQLTVTIKGNEDTPGLRSGIGLRSPFAKYSYNGTELQTLTHFAGIIIKNKKKNPYHVT